MSLTRYIADYKAIIRLGLPILVGQLGMIAVGFADNIMVGHYSTQALASASFVNNVFNVVIFCCMGFSYGITPLVGTLFGRGEHDRIGSLMRNALALNLIFTLSVMGLMTFVYFNLHRLGQPDELMPLIRPYYLIFLAGLLPMCIFNVFAQWAYGIKNSGMPMWIILAANVLNIAGDYLLIFGKSGCPELGLSGAGFATLASRIFTAVAILSVFCLQERYRVYRRGFAAARCTTGQISRVWRTSIPVSMQMSFESGSFTFAAIMAGWLGTISLASFQVIVIIGTLGFCLYYAIGAAISVLVANEAGTGSRPGMRRVAWAGYHIILAVATCSSLFFIFCAKLVIGFFTSDPEVVALTLTLIFPLALYQYGDATQITFANALRGTSNVMPMLWIAAVCYVVVGIPATYFLGFPAGMGTYGIILSFSVSLFLAGGLFLYYFLRTTRKR